MGQFVVHCPYSHSAPDDPIVHYGKHGAAHRHDFYGATDTDSRSTDSHSWSSVHSQSDR